MATRSPRAVHRANRNAIAGLLGLGLTACFPPDNGRSPPLDRIYFPVGLVAQPDPAGEHSRLYVVNSDFDLQFNAGTVQSYDLDAIEALVPKYCNSAGDCASGACDSKISTDPRHLDTHLCLLPDGAGQTSPCGPLGMMTPGQVQVTPGICNYIEPSAPVAIDGNGKPGSSLLTYSVSIGAFATDMIYEMDPTAGSHGADAGSADAGAAKPSPVNTRGRFFIPVRGDATLHWIDVNPLEGGGTLECGQGGNGGACDSNHQRGETPAEENTRGVDVTLPPEPYGVASDSVGEAILTTHQSTGQVALFVNQWGASADASDGPTLQYVLSNLPAGALAIASVPEPAVYTDCVRNPPTFPCPAPVTYLPSFLLTYSNSATVSLIHYFSDGAGSTGAHQVAGANPARPFIEADDSVAIRTNSQGFTSRGIAVDGSDLSKRRTLEALCASVPADQRQACLLNAAATPLDVYVSNRTPATLILGQTQPDTSTTLTSDLPSFYDTLQVSVGASRVIVGKVNDGKGNQLTRVFLVCFDQRQIYVYDPAVRRFETIINTGEGPHAFAVDPEKGLGFIGHFTESYIGVVDLNLSHIATYGRILLNVGQPVPPRASK